MSEAIPEFHAPSTRHFRQWLQKNHATAKSLWLIIYKKDSGVASVNYAEAVEEALCFGWIDSKPNKRDDKSFKLFFAPRKSGSPWSKVNKIRVAQLIRDKRMAAPGLAKIEAAKKDGSWTKLDAIEAMVMPKALKEAFRTQKKAATFFDAFPPSVKKGIFHWIDSAKTEETRSKRVSETVRLAALNQRANQWRKTAS